MENELHSKCHSLLFWEEFRPLHHQGMPKCIHCHTNPLSKLSLPFWFIKLEDGSIPQIRFTKQETNLKVKKFKKFITSLLSTQLNTSNFDRIETSMLGVHYSHYQLLNKTSMASANNEEEKQNISTQDKLTLLVRHIEPEDFLLEQNHELHYWTDKIPLNITAKQVQQMDVNSSQIVSTSK